MIVDCFTFYNEFKMLDFRLAELRDTVDMFVLVEGSTTFTGKNKPFYYEENKDRYKDYPIIHVKLNWMPEGPDNWARERYQRNSIDKGLRQLSLQNDDIIFISDVDEIWDKQVIPHINSNEWAYQLFQDMYYYNPTVKFDWKWHKARAFKYGYYRNFKEPELIRNNLSSKLLMLDEVPGGWHFSYFGDEQYIKNKLNSFSHQELNSDEIDIEYIRKKVLEGKELFEEDVYKTNIIKVENNDYLPNNIGMLL